MENIYSIIDKLDRIEKKIDGKYMNRYLDINQVSKMGSISCSTIRREVQKRTLKCSKKLGKLLFLESDVRKWIED